MPNASFINSGGRHPTPTAADGTAFMGRLTPGSYADIALDASTLEDLAVETGAPRGARAAAPRPGAMLEFPVVSTSEIDGTVYLLDKTGNTDKRGIGDAVVELVDSQGVVVMSTPSASDGFYLLRQVMPGRYVLHFRRRKPPSWRWPPRWSALVEVMPDGDFISGQDLELKPVTP